MQNPNSFKLDVPLETPFRASDANTAMVHLYRAEITRANSWRNRLDVTTNWALIATGAAISFAFSQTATHHSVIILNTLLITLFLFIETRRYRYYELWSYRIRLIETDFYAAMLLPPHTPDPDLANKLAETLLHPQFPISTWEALGRRLRRNYMWIYVVLLSTWFAKLMLYPTAIESWNQLVTRARIGVAPGWAVMAVVLGFYAMLLALAIMTRRLRQSVGEVLPDDEDFTLPQRTKPIDGVDPQMQTAAELEQAERVVALVSTTTRTELIDRIKAQFEGKITQLDADNTSGTRITFILPVKETEIATLKALVKEVDQDGIVVVMPTGEILALTNRR